MCKHRIQILQMPFLQLTTTLLVARFSLFCNAKFRNLSHPCSCWMAYIQYRSHYFFVPYIPSWPSGPGACHTVCQHLWPHWPMVCCQMMLNYGFLGTSKSRNGPLLCDPLTNKIASPSLLLPLAGFYS